MPSKPNRLSPPVATSAKIADRKASGRCRCGSILTDGAATCLADRRASFLARRRRKQKGLCSACGKQKSDPGYVTCTRCRMVASAYYHRRKLTSPKLSKDYNDKKRRAKLLEPVVVR